jgi:cytochrome oxidase Cu insertion factor (SCO1/SenC/PrrC family)
MQRLALLLVAVIAATGLAWAQSTPYPKPQIASAEGKIAPDFSLKNQEGTDFKLSDQRRHWVLLFFYRGYW